MSNSHASWIAKLAPAARPALAEALRRHAVRQVATLKASGAALAHAPTLDDRIGAIERAKEELQHLEQASEVYRELSGGDLLQDAESAAAKLPIPESWVEASVAQLVLCLAARVDLSRHREVPRPFRATAERALADETEHVSAACAALAELCAQSPAMAQNASGFVQRWLPVALESLDEDGAREAYLSELAHEAEEIGLPLRRESAV